MKVVSAAKLRKAQLRIVQMRPYALKLRMMISQLSSSLEGSDAAKFYEERPIQRVLLLVVSSDKGLAGSFNSSIAKEALRLREGKYSHLKADQIDIITIGKKGRDALVRSSVPLLKEYNGFFSSLSYEGAEEIADYAMNSFIEGKYDAVEVLYNQFKNAAVYITGAEQFLPIKVSGAEQGEDTKQQVIDYIFEPSKEAIISELVYKSLKIDFFRTLLESNAAEHGARMTSMDKATENAEELLRMLKLTYNRERQAAITKEILEIVGGAAAIGN